MNAFRSGLRGIEKRDPDGDGYTNVAEIEARSFPEDPEDHPVTD